MKLRSLLFNGLFLVLLLSCANKNNEVTGHSQSSRPNILLIPIDDLRPELGAYGNTVIKTPNIDQLAANGVTFMRAYTQQALCNPSRASLLTGLRPDTIEVWDLQASFRKNLPEAVTLPQFFKAQGYTTIGLGKTFHNDIPDTISWTRKPHPEGFPFDPDAFYANESNRAIQEQVIQRLKDQGRSRIDQLGYWYVKAEATEIGEGDDDVYFDGAQTTAAIEILQELATQSEPFFLSVGYYRPHLPFNAPKKYWDLYDPMEIPLAANQFLPEASPEYAVHGDAEMRSYVDQGDLPWPKDKPADEARQRHLKHGYYASVSYVDAQIGRLIKELKRLGLDKNTIIVLWGDHGWKLGEHNSWGKMSNFEIDTHVPLIFSGAGLPNKGVKAAGLTEFLDIYPTLVDMAGFEIPDYLQGKSLEPIFKNPNQQYKDAAFSQYLLGRFGPPETRKKERMGYSVRTDRYRYTEWYAWDDSSNRAGELLDRELYDHTIDTQENKNIASDQNSTLPMTELSARLKENFSTLAAH
ncbi:sulfatase [Algoriphagus jejuensis]|uniref:Sulfatase n=1 Tax=Algoriphagus jejuensis TaxID=419934 RepID=A0ABN1N6J6_9BACT